MNKVHLPPGLLPLVRRYDDAAQGPVAYDPYRWLTKLARVATVDEILGALEHPVYTRPAKRGRRSVTRAAIVESLKGNALERDGDVLRSYLLMTAWGTGTRIAPWTFAHVERSLHDRDRLLNHLRRSAEQLRSLGDSAVSGTGTVAADWSVPGVGQAFYTKWFAFAGHADGRSWQPLILDARVERSLSSSLSVSLRELSGCSLRTAGRYAAYVELMHRWAADLDVQADASRLEWILFAHNGRPVEVT